MKPEAAVVTGAGCLCAAGASLTEVAPVLYAGQRNPAAPSRFATELERSYVVFEVDAALAQPGGDSFSVDAGRTARLALTAAEEALKQARVDREQLWRRRVGVCLGTTVGCTLNNESFYRAYRASKHPELTPVIDYLKANPALCLAREYGLSGPVATLANACSSGTDAIGLARQWLAAGMCDMALAGGADELSRIAYLGFISLLISSGEACRPFDRERQGLNLGEGAGVVLLETARSAEERGARSLAEVAGYGSAADAYHPTAPHPEGIGLKRAIDTALRAADIKPEGIDFVNAHGTATPDNDQVEGRVLGEKFPDTPVVATKAYTGHTLGAAGGIEAALTVQALLDSRLPATVGFAQPDPACAITPTTSTMSLRAKTALSTSLAFGGGNSALVLKGVDA